MNGLFNLVVDYFCYLDNFSVQPFDPPPLLGQGQTYTLYGADGALALCMALAALTGALGAPRRQ